MFNYKIATINSVTNNADLQEFVGKIINLKPAGGIIVRTGSNGNVLNVLKQQTISFMRLYQSSNSSLGELNLAAQKVEGSLRTTQVLSVISEEQADQLIDKLYSFVNTN
jgi:hypothetical protein